MSSLVEPTPADLLLHKYDSISYEMYMYEVLLCCLFATLPTSLSNHSLKKELNPIYVENYRPISILNNFAKAFDQVLYDTIYANTKSLISASQDGFMAGRSTVTTPASCTQCISKNLDDHGKVDVIFTVLCPALRLRSSISIHLLSYPR